jgi:hypothetical protein
MKVDPISCILKPECIPNTINKKVIKSSHTQQIYIFVGVVPEN